MNQVSNTKITTSFQMNGRNKTFTGQNIKICLEKLISDYVEAIPEIYKIEIREDVDGVINEQMFKGHNVCQDYISRLRLGFKI